MVNRIGPQTGVELPQAAAGDSRAGAGCPRRAPEAGAAGTSEPVASVLQAGETPGSGGKSARKLAAAAQEFESLLLAQILKTAREAGSGGWLGGGESHGMSATMELAEAQLARAMAESGALGIGKLLASQVRPPSSDAGETVRDGSKAEGVQERGRSRINSAPRQERAAAGTSRIPDQPVAPKLRASR